jgi:tripartite-type tricarboxylate transporter receptor subunit TctC
VPSKPAAATTSTPGRGTADAEVPAEQDRFHLQNLDAAAGVEALTKLYTPSPTATPSLHQGPRSIVSQMTLGFAKYDCEKITYIGNITTDHDALVVKQDSADQLHKT